MELRPLKIQLVNRLLACEDPRILSAIARLLELDNPPTQENSATEPLEQEAREIQESLDDLFSGKG